MHDQGIVLDHEDLAAHIWVNEAEMNGAEGVDDDGNGYKDDIHGWNYINNSPDIIPEGHGTHVAGTISAVNNNGIGVCGVAGGTGEEDGVRIMSLQILYQPVAGGSSQFSERAPETYAYAADNGAVISQNSWTLGVTGKLPYSYEQAFTYFNENAGMDDTDGDGVNDVQTGPMAGGIIIFAAGNAGGPTLLPAASDKVIAVAASGPNYEKGFLFELRSGDRHPCPGRCRFAGRKGECAQYVQGLLHRRGRLFASVGELRWPARTFRVWLH